MTDDIKIVRNPDYAGIQPHLLGPACHDGSPFLQFRCGCGADSHLHESVLDTLPRHAKQIGLNCSGCHEPMHVSLSALRGAFAQMRREGWHR